MTWIFWKRKRNLQEKRISDIDLADDIALFSDTKEGLQEMIDETSQDASLANLKIAVGVTKNAYTNLISFGKLAGSNKNLQTKELETAPRVDSYRHLGHLQDNETSSTIKDRLKLACSSFASMRGIWIIYGLYRPRWTKTEKKSGVHEGGPGGGPGGGGHGRAIFFRKN